jgi:sugar O-acyltransferase (sialic acid O-acetyltransferase NeuD family)
VIDTRPIVLFGTGGVASVIRYVLDHESPYRVAALTVDRTHVDAAPESDLEVVPFEDVASRYPPSEFGMFVAVGFSRMNGIRAARYVQARDMGYELISHVSDRTSTWPGFEPRPNTIIMEDCTIGPAAVVGEDCIVWPRCYIGHEATIGEHSYLAANASISGRTVVGARSVIGSAAVVRDGVTVGEACIVGVGAVLTTNLEANSVIAAPLPRHLPGRSDRLPDL